MPPEAPIKEEALATAGSARTVSAMRCCKLIMALKETSGEASVKPKIRPVSSCGKPPLGKARNKATEAAITRTSVDRVIQGWLSTGRRLCWYRLTMPSKKASKCRSSQLWVVSVSRFIKREQIIGATLSEMKVETIMAKANVRANSRNIWPMAPSMNSIGIKAAIKDSEIENTVNPICFAPSRAACRRVSPCSNWAWMFSTTTIASSTTKPTAMVIAKSDKLSSVKPASHMAANVPARDKGTVRPTASVCAARRKNSITTSITNKMAAPKVTIKS